ncbi:major facilitator superfamily domain-containing protein [Lyophyllum atratum]|nr:major facilitator superfamily domain-containing protein [Lyophyllum atratum]
MATYTFTRLWAGVWYVVNTPNPGVPTRNSLHIRQLGHGSHTWMSHILGLQSFRFPPLPKVMPPDSTVPSPMASQERGIDDPSGYNGLSKLPGVRKVVLLVFLCIAQFLDTFANSALFAAIPPISVELGISNADSVWLISGYQLTFASLLLISGRLSDLYNPKFVFLSGAAAISVFSLAAGFVRTQVPLIVLRALMGVGASLTVPSALYLIIHLFPDPGQQSKAVAAFAASAAIGNVIGLIIGALIVSYSSWPWVFYTFAILGAVLVVMVMILSPSPRRAHVSALEKARRFKRLDLTGVFLLTSGLVLFIFGVTTGSVNGWNTARCLAPLIISLFLIAGFFLWEARLPEDMAAIPPSLWAYTNFGILVASATLPFMWWGTVQLLFSWIWQNVYGWTPIIAAVHFLPLGLLGFPVTGMASALQQKFPLKWVIVGGQVIAMAGTLLLPFADSPGHYWRFAFPGFCLGTSGITIAFATVNIAIFTVTPPEKAGVVGSIFNCFLQLGCAAGTAIITSIQTSVDDSHGGPTVWNGRAAGLWFLFALLTIETACIVIFMHNTVPPTKHMVPVKEVEGEKVSESPSGGEDD